MAVHALIVDDDPVVAMIMSAMMEQTQFHLNPTLFPNGLLAIDHFRENYNINDTFLVFLDLHMPVMDGWKFLDEINGVAEPSNTFVFIITSSISQSDKNKASKYNFVSKFISKPVLTETFTDIKEILEVKSGKMFNEL